MKLQFTVLDNLLYSTLGITIEWASYITGFLMGILLSFIISNFLNKFFNN